MLVLSADAIAEVTIKRSRFIGELTTVNTADEARSVLKAKKESWAVQGITHLVHAFITGPGANVMGCSDDGEPAGTAGRPTLEVLKGSGITNVLLTTARFFGGIKLGTGGLVKAYTEIAQLVLANAQTLELVPRSRFSIQAPYAYYERLKLLLADHQATLLNERFDTGVTLESQAPDARLAEIESLVRDMTRGQALFKNHSISTEK